MEGILRYYVRYIEITLLFLINSIFHTPNMLTSKIMVIADGVAPCYLQPYWLVRNQIHLVFAVVLKPQI